MRILEEVFIYSTYAKTRLHTLALLYIPYLSCYYLFPLLKKCINNFNNKYLLRIYRISIAVIGNVKISGVKVMLKVCGLGHLVSPAPSRPVQQEPASQPSHIPEMPVMLNYISRIGIMSMAKTASHIWGQPFGIA